MNILYISHISCLRVENDIPMFEAAGHKVILLNNHKTHLKKYLPSYPQFRDIINLYESNSTLVIKVKNKLGEIIKKICTYFKLDKLTFINYLREKWDVYKINHVSQKTKEKIVGIISERNIDLVYAAWGTTVFQEINVIKQSNVSVPIVWSIQSYPVREYRLSDRNDNIPEKEKEIIENIEGRIHCSREMYDYFSKHFKIKDYGDDIIYPGYWKSTYFYRRQLPKLSNVDKEPHVVFIGDTKFSQRTFNDIRSQIKEILNNDIHIHFAKTKDRLAGNKAYIHMFEKKDVTNGELATFMTQFDACVMMYNLDKKYLRYKISLPERFLFALNAGIPVICPKDYYQVCADVIEKYRIGFVYKDSSQLKVNLQDKMLIESCSANARKLKERLTFEDNYENLEEFLQKIIKNKKVVSYG